MYQTIFQELSFKYGLKKKRKKLPFKTFKKPVNHPELYAETMKLILTYGVKPWKTAERAWYSGIGLTYDRFNTDDKLSQVLGNDGNPFYTEAMLYNNIIPEAERLFEILDIPLTPVRSRIAVINGEHEFSRNDGWHVDESPYENLRLNIPITTTPDFLFQLEDSPPEHFEEGWCYWWDSSKPHRVFSSKQNSFNRIHLVLGFSPWFMLQEGRWVPNEYFNKVHPLEII